MDPIVEALRNISYGNLENDRALLKLCEALIERVLELERRVLALEDLRRNAKPFDNIRRAEAACRELERRVLALEDNHER